MATPQRPLAVSLHLHPTVSISAIPVPVAEVLANLIVSKLGCGLEEEMDRALETLAKDLAAVVEHANR